MAGEVAVKGSDILVAIHDGTDFVTVEKQNEGTYTPGVSASIKKHKNGQTPIREEAGSSFNNNFTKTRPLLPGQALAYQYHKSGELAQVRVADKVTGGVTYEGMAQIVLGEEASGVSGTTIDVPMTVTWDGQPVESVTA